jgi:hypothetical protein
MVLVLSLVGGRPGGRLLCIAALHVLYLRVMYLSHTYVSMARMLVAGKNPEARPLQARYRNNTEVVMLAKVVVRRGEDASRSA